MTTIDSIVRSALMSSRLTIHYYLEAAHYGLKCLRELEFDVVGNVYSGKFTVDAFNEIALPEGYIDYVRMGKANGPYIIPIANHPSFSRIENEDASNNVAAYTAPGAYVQYGLDGLVWAGHVNYYGEPTGGFFGGSGTDSDTFMIIRERNKARIGSNLSPGDVVYMDYLADMPASATSLVHPYAESTIEAYIKYCMAKYKRMGDEDRAKYEYNKEMKKLRGRTNGLTKEELRRIARNNIKQTVK